jgi:hypothetical protein
MEDMPKPCPLALINFLGYDPWLHRKRPPSLEAQFQMLFEIIYIFIDLLNISYLNIMK